MIFTDRSVHFRIHNLEFEFNLLKAKLSMLLSCGFFLAACGSMPNLEKPGCADARNTVREFYSLHFGSDMQPSEEYLRRREKFLTADWKLFVSKNLQDKRDFFTLTEDYPKAFRIGGCEAVEPNQTIFQVVFFWKDDARTEQREVKVEAIKKNGNWLINRTF